MFYYIVFNTISFYKNLIFKYLYNELTNSQYIIKTTNYKLKRTIFVIVKENTKCPILTLIIQTKAKIRI